MYFLLPKEIFCHNGLKLDLNLHPLCDLFSWHHVKLYYRGLSLKVFCVFVVWWINLSCILMCWLMFPQIHCADHLSWNHGPRRGQTETHRRQNPWILFLKCKELQIKKHQLKPCSLLSLISYKEVSVGRKLSKRLHFFQVFSRSPSDEVTQVLVFLVVW